jgi:hypothetical protein
MGPQILHRIELWGVWRQVFQVCRARQDAFVDELALVGLEAVPDEHNGRVQLALQMLEKVQGKL